MTNVRAMAGIILGGIGFLSSTESACAQGMAVNPAAMAFVYQAGGVTPGAQTLFVSGATPTSFVVAPSVPWLTVSPTTAVTPATLVVTVRPPADITAATISGSIVIEPLGIVDAVPIVVPVSLQILGPPAGNLVVSPTSMAADYRIGGPVPSLPPISITSTGGPAVFSLSTSTASGGAWLSVLTTSLVTPATAYAVVAPTENMAPGVYTGTVSILPAYAGGRVTSVAVTLRVSTVGTLEVSPGFVSFEYVAGGSVPPVQYLKVADLQGGSAPFSVSVSTGSGMWLSVTPVSGATPATLAVRVIPDTTTPGTRYGIVTVQPSKSTQPTQIPVSLLVTRAAQLNISPQSLSLNYQIGAPALPPQYVSVTSTGVPLSFTARTDGPLWVTVPNQAFVTPAGLAVSINPPTTTVPGEYRALVTLTPTGDGSNPVSVPITIQIKAANSLSLSRNAVSFVYSAGQALPTEVVSITSSGGAAQIQAAASSSWVTVSQPASYTPTSISIGVLPAGLAPGTYQDKINVFSEDVSNSPQTIQVTLTVSTDPLFSAAPFGLMFSYQIGAAPPTDQLAVITNTMAGQEFSVSAETDNGGKWLVVAGGGIAPGAVAAGVNTTTLTTPGMYSGTLVVTPKSASTPALRVPVFVNVSTGPGLRTNSTLVAFQYQTGGPPLATQKLPVGTTGGSVAFLASVQTADGGAWLKAKPDFSSAPVDLTVTADPTGLAPGLYLGLIVLTGTGPEELFYYVPVTLQVSSGPILIMAGQSVIFRGDAGGSPPAAQTVTASSTGQASAIAASASSPGWLRVDPTSATGTLNLSVQSSPQGLDPGYHLGLITIHIPGVTNSEQYVPVALTLSGSAR